MSLSSNNLQMLLKTAIELGKDPGVLSTLSELEVVWVKHECQDGDGGIVNILLPDIKIYMKENH
jgi:hypothetical protein